MTTKKNETNLPENTEPVRASVPNPSIPNQSDFQSVGATLAVAQSDIQSDSLPNPSIRAGVKPAPTTNPAKSVAQSNTEPVRASVPNPSIRAGVKPAPTTDVQPAPFAQNTVGDLLTAACSLAGINPKTLLDWAIKENRVILINSRGEKISIQWPPA